jgi:hypothetical protein
MKIGDHVVAEAPVALQAFKQQPPCAIWYQWDKDVKTLDGSRIDDKSAYCRAGATDARAHSS